MKNQTWATSHFLTILLSSGIILFIVPLMMLIMNLINRHEIELLKPTNCYWGYYGSGSRKRTSHNIQYLTDIKKSEYRFFCKGNIIIQVMVNESHYGTKYNKTINSNTSYTEIEITMLEFISPLLVFISSIPIFLIYLKLRKKQ